MRTTKTKKTILELTRSIANDPPTSLREGNIRDVFTVELTRDSTYMTGVAYSTFAYAMPLAHKVLC